MRSGRGIADAIAQRKKLGGSASLVLADTGAC
jgi:hypothetical protein